MVNRTLVRQAIRDGNIVKLQTPLGIYTLYEGKTAFVSNFEPSQQRTYPTLEDLLFDVFFKFRAQDMEILSVMSDDDSHDIHFGL